MSELDLSGVEILPNLPDYFRPEEGQPLPDELAGATIVGVGTVPAPLAITGGGLVIDYRKPGGREVRRVVLAFNDIAMWVAYAGVRKQPANPGSVPAARGGSQRRRA